MKPLLRGERAPSLRARVLPALSRLEPLRAWARESLAARLIAIAMGLTILAAIGSSALARGASAPVVLAATAAPAAASVPAAPTPPAPTAAVATAVDAGAPGVPPPAPSVPQDHPSSRASTRATPDDPVDLNSATLDDLRRLPGVGAKRAEAILAVRARLGGRFRQIEDLLKVKGIGRASLRRLHPLVRLDSAPRS